MVWKKIYTHHFKLEWNSNFYPELAERRSPDLFISTIREVFFKQQMYQIYMCRCCRTVTFLTSSCFSLPSQKCQNTTWIHNFPNICCADVWFKEKLKVPKLFYFILLTGNWWIWFLYLQNQIRLAASTMGEGLEVFRIWNLSDQGPKEKETKERKEERN